MKGEKLSDLSTLNENTENSEKLSSKNKKESSINKTRRNKQPKIEPPPPWSTFLRDANEFEIKERFVKEMNDIFSSYEEKLSNYCFLSIFDPLSSIGSFDLDQVYNALTTNNPNMDKDVLLFILSRGGAIEPAYQISKLCKSYSKHRFVVAIPRQAKSAATLISIGADEIHMGPLSQLGPIDPQLGGLPALGVTQALNSIAALSEQFPGSSDMFARYLRMALTVEQIGYCERISESAAQYAERLLLTKSSLPKMANDIAHKLVHEYKDHGFVIDLDEAKQNFGNQFILEGTPEIEVAEKFYKLFDDINFFLGFYRKKRFLVIGSFDTGSFIFNKQD